MRLSKGRGRQTGQKRVTAVRGGMGDRGVGPTATSVSSQATTPRATADTPKTGQAPPHWRSMGTLPRRSSSSLLGDDVYPGDDAQACSGTSTRAGP